MSEFTAVQQHFSDNLPQISLAFNEPMSRHTSFRVGGNAEVMAFPKSAQELSLVLRVSAALGCPRAILGAGTNVLAPDEGISGIVIGSG